MTSTKQKEITADVSVLAKLFEKFMIASAEAQRELAEKTGTVNGSRSLNAAVLAVLAGLPPQLAYTIAQTSKYSGIPGSMLRAEHKAGALKFIKPAGQERGYMITCDEMDRWLADSVS